MSSDLRTLDLDARQEADFELLANGGFAPLHGFQGSADWDSVVEKMRLANGQPWPIPITLGSDLDVSEGEVVELRGRDGGRLGELRVEEIYERDLGREADEVYGTTDAAHPGVAALLAEPARTLAGPITPSALPEHPAFVKPHLYTPEESRAVFRERGWKTVVGFQTRNPIHRAHEYLTKAALETVDGLFLQPLVGETKSGDIPAEVRMRCYEVLIERYYNDEHVLLGVYPAAMRYAGPREAVLHALARRNYGCTHFIVGRDHAGVGSYYETYAAQEIFSEFTVAELGIEPMMFEHAFWCTVSKAMASAKTSPSSPQERVFLSGTAVREMLELGERPPEEFTRPEVADVLIDSYSQAGTPA